MIFWLNLENTTIKKEQANNKIQERRNKIANLNSELESKNEILKTFTNNFNNEAQMGCKK